jgi:hypothetical protein
VWIAAAIRTVLIFSRIFGNFIVIMTKLWTIICPGILMILFVGCIERYYPEEDDLRTGTLVINAHLTNRAGEQVIEISRSAPLTYPSFDPVSGSLAEVIREDGEYMVFSESEPGYYKAVLDEPFLQTGSSYMLHVITPDGNEYESDFDILRPVPAIDSMYYEVETNSFASESDSISGIRFYCDFTYDDEDYEYIRWDLTETYEYHNSGDLEYFHLDADHRINPVPDSFIYTICYISNELFQIHSMSLENLDFGHYIKKPFSFVPNDEQEQKLHHKYSLFVRQYSLGEEAFYYWNELKKNSQEQGWLFDRQPALLKSNIRNVNDENEFVLGFFSMAGMVEKRAFAIKPEGLDLSPWLNHCYPRELPPGALWRVGGNYPYDPRPMYFTRPRSTDMEDQPDFPMVRVNKSCVDCREYKNSTHIPPDFW